MTFQLQTEKAEDLDRNINKAESVITHENVFGKFAIVDDHLVTPKTIAILSEAMERDIANKCGHGIYSIVFRNDGQPWGKRRENGTHKMNAWRFYWGPKAAVCNLQHCIKLALETSQKEIVPGDDENAFMCMSVHMLVWKNILQGFFHECRHAQQFAIDIDGELIEAIDAGDEEALNAAEKDADEYSRELLFKLAKEFELEPEFSQTVVEEINKALEAAFEDIETDPKAPEGMLKWLEAQRMLIERGGVFYSPGNPSEGEDDHYLKTFKEFLFMCSGDSEDDKSWDMKPKELLLTLEQEPWKESSSGGTAVHQAETNTVDTDCNYNPEYDGDFEYPSGFQGVGQFQQGKTQAQQMWEWEQNQVTGQQPAQQWQQQAVQPQYQQPVQHDYSSYGYPHQPVQQAPVQPQTQQWQQQPQQAPAQPTQNDQATVVGGMAYAPLNIATEDVKRIVYGLFKKLNAHIFAGCQFNPANLSTPFEAVSNIMTPLPLTKEEMMFVKEMTIAEEGGSKRGGVKCNGAIQGTIIDKSGKLPGYEFVIQSPEGHQLVRKLIPQNPNKPKKDGAEGELTFTAKEARQGNNILWLLDVMSGKFIGRIYNGQVQKYEAGKWVSAE